MVAGAASTTADIGGGLREETARCRRFKVPRLDSFDGDVEVDEAQRVGISGRHGEARNDGETATTVG